MIFLFFSLKALVEMGSCTFFKFFFVDLFSSNRSVLTLIFGFTTSLGGLSNISVLTLILGFDFFFGVSSCDISIFPSSSLRGICSTSICSSSSILGIFLSNLNTLFLGSGLIFFGFLIFTS